MAKSLGDGMTLVMSIWDDASVNMLWLDSDYPTTDDPSKPGVARGTCATTSGVPSDVRKAHPDSNVTYSDIRFGDIGSTFPGGKPTPPGPTGDKYKCESGICVASATGVSKDICSANCTPSADLFRCEAGACVKSTTGVSKDICSANCIDDAKYECKENQCVKRTDGKGINITECKAFCGTI